MTLEEAVDKTIEVMKKAVNDGQFTEEEGREFIKAIKGLLK